MDPSGSNCDRSGYQEGERKEWAYFGQETPREILIIEPCNYASNIAYYHSAKRICDYPE